MLEEELDLNMSMLKLAKVLAAHPATLSHPDVLRD